MRAVVVYLGYGYLGGPAPSSASRAEPRLHELGQCAQDRLEQRLVRRDGVETGERIAVRQECIVEFDPVAGTENGFGERQHLRLLNVHVLKVKAHVQGHCGLERRAARFVLVGLAYQL